MKKPYFRLILVLMIVITAGVAFKSPEIAMIFAATSVSAILLDNLENLDKLELFGLKAKLKEKIQEAEVTIEHLRSLAVSLSQPAISLITMHGNITKKFTHDYKAALIKQINDQLRYISIPEDHIREANRLWYFQNLNDHALRITEGLYPNYKEEIEKLLALGEDGAMVGTPEQYLELLKKHNLLDNHRKELVEDFAYYRKNREYRRPELWSSL
jgi:hypothetical protein